MATTHTVTGTPHVGAPVVAPVPTGVTTPLNPFPPSPYITTPNAIPFTGIFTVLFIIILLIWFIYTLIVSYHWFRYGHRSVFAIPAIVLHVFVSGFCIFFALSGL